MVPLPAWSEIVPYLYQGSVPVLENLPGTFSAVVLAAREFQFDHIREQDLVRKPNPFAATNRPRRFTILRCPLDDYEEVPGVEFADVVATACDVARYAYSRRPVLVTCAAGLNRSGLITGLALHSMYQGAMSGENIVRLIQSKRSPMALSNRVFRRIVEDGARFRCPLGLPRGR